MEEQIPNQTKTEIIAFCSGKGGTGKSLLCSCLGYALTRSGQRVLMIDGDPATDGLSLFLLGPKGMDQVGAFSEQNTFVGALEEFKHSGKAFFEAHPIHRRGEDHGVTYNAVISGRGIYGEQKFMGQVVPDLDQATFRKAIRYLFEQLRASGEYDYILVDTRGGFAFESSDVCALADSFIVITEPDFTSFYQDRNLVARIASSAKDLESPSFLRAIIVNKAMDSTPQPGVSYLDTLEVSFRNELAREFNVKYADTHPVPVALEVLLAYKVQRIPYISNPESIFCFATLTAFSDILTIVTSRWSNEHVDKWNELVDIVGAAVTAKQKASEEQKQSQENERRSVEVLKTELSEARMRLDVAVTEAAASLELQRVQFEERIASLQREIADRSLLYEREFARSQTFESKLASESDMAKVPNEKPVPLMPEGVGPHLRVNVISYLVLGMILVGGIILGLSFIRNGNKPSIVGSQPIAPKSAGTKFSPDVSQKGDAAVNDKGTDFMVPGAGSNSLTAGFGLLLASGKDLLPEGDGGNSASYEAVLALSAGLRTTAIYQKSDSYFVVATFPTLADAKVQQSKLDKVKLGRWAKKSFIVPLPSWCPTISPPDQITSREFTISTYSCISPAAN